MPEIRDWAWLILNLPFCFLLTRMYWDSVRVLFILIPNNFTSLSLTNIITAKLVLVSILIKMLPCLGRLPDYIENKICFFFWLKYSFFSHRTESSLYKPAENIFLNLLCFRPEEAWVSANISRREKINLEHKKFEANPEQHDFYFLFLKMKQALWRFITIFVWRFIVINGNIWKEGQRFSRLIYKNRDCEAQVYFRYWGKLLWNVLDSSSVRKRLSPFQYCQSQNREFEFVSAVLLRAHKRATLFSTIYVCHYVTNTLYSL